jgi:hypothetical protein
MAAGRASVGEEMVPELMGAVWVLGDDIPDSKRVWGRSQPCERHRSELDGRVHSAATHGSR